MSMMRRDNAVIINPRLQEIPPSGIRAFLIWLRVTTILSHWEWASRTSQHPRRLELPAFVRWIGGDGVHL